jgi:hypothetical protein
MAQPLRIVGAIDDQDEQKHAEGEGVADKDEAIAFEEKRADGNNQADQAAQSN